MSEKLKPCPFCGGLAWPGQDATVGTQFWITCGDEKCSAEQRPFDDLEDAITAWNTRPDIRRETIEEILHSVLTYDFIEGKWEDSVNSIKMDHCQISGALHALRKGIRVLAEDQP